MQESEEKSDWILNFPGYDEKDFQVINEKLIRGEFLLNVSATCIVYNSIISAL